VVAVHRPEEGTEPTFVCERVCTSDRLLRRMGGLSKDPTPNTCVTVCGVGGATVLNFSATFLCSEFCPCQTCIWLSLDSSPAGHDTGASFATCHISFCAMQQQTPAQKLASEQCAQICIKCRLGMMLVSSGALQSVQEEGHFRKGIGRASC
jgi:hypothetical protein